MTSAAGPAPQNPSPPARSRTWSWCETSSASSFPWCDYLRTVSYQQGYVEQIRLPQYQMIDVIVDPRINSGTPTIARRGIRGADVVSPLAAGESTEDVARDYRLDPREIAPLTA